MHSKSILLAIVAATVAMLSPPVSGQTSQGSISGLVTDQSGASVPEVAINVSDVGRNITFRSFLYQFRDVDFGAGVAWNRWGNLDALHDVLASQYVS